MFNNGLKGQNSSAAGIAEAFGRYGTLIVLPDLLLASYFLY